MAKLKPWYQVVTPREDLRDGRPLDASEFAVNLDHIRTGRENVSKDYTDPARFFDRTFLTGSLLNLFAQVETSAVFNNATQFGGGKTHALTTLYHLARGGDTAKNWKGVDSILRKADVSSLPQADVAAVAQHDERRLAPAGDVIRKMLPPGPILILMDELLNYVSGGRKIGMRDQFFNFLQNLCEEIRARNNAVLCVSIPRSDLEMNPDQYGQPIMVAEVEWTATGGSIDSKGMFVAGKDGGAFTASAKADGSEAIAEVRIATKGDTPVIVDTSNPRTIRWSGNVPPQKWMQFYTKVLSKYATSPDLKIEVSFQMKVEQDQADAKAAETKTGLRELGLDDGVSG